jgi:hypothetical protein
MLENKQLIDKISKFLLVILIIISVWRVIAVGYFIFLLLKCPDKGNFEYFVYAFMSLLTSLPIWVGTFILGIVLRKKVKKYFFIGSIIPSTIMVFYILLIVLRTVS